MKKLALVFVFVALNLANTGKIDDINKKIRLTKQTIQKHESSQKKLNKSLEDLALEISSHKKTIAKYSKEQKILENQITALLKNVKANEHELNTLQQSQQKLKKQRNDIELELIDLMITDISTNIIAKEREYTQKDIIQTEALAKVRNKTNLEIQKVREKFLIADKKLANVSAKVDKLSQEIATLKSKQKRVLSLKEQEKKELLAISQKQKHYEKDLTNIISQKKKERKLLADLDIIKAKTLSQVRQKEAQESEKIKDKATQTKVKKYGSSYLAVGKKHYSGKKYKPPIDDRFAFKVTKKFGPYVDPIYNIKIHNDYIAMQTEKQDTIVRTIMRGKVVFANNLQTLGNVVIVQHDNNMHTIYRNLAKISPNIKVNARLKEREAVGRVRDELVFEVTKDGIPIDPLEIISVPKRYF